MKVERSLPRRDSLAQQAEQLLRARILEGLYRPGERLIEARLSEELGVSRSPLREALNGLEREGLVVSDARGSVSVAELDVEQILQLFEVRTALEIIAIQHATARADHHALADDLAAILEPLRSRELTFVNQIATDLAFHERLCEASANPTLLTVWRQLASQIRIMILAAGPEEGRERMRYEQHSPLVDAVRAGDVAASAAAMQDHMAAFRAQWTGTGKSAPSLATDVAGEASSDQTV